MQAAHKFESICIDKSETILFAGTLGGTISVIDIDTFTQRSWMTAHAGTIIAMTTHQTQPIIATLSMDQTVTAWEYSDDGLLTPICSTVVRGLRPTNDIDATGIDFVGNSQALGLHATKRRLVTRTSNAGVLELDFSSGHFETISCTRHHGAADLIMSVYVADTDQVLSSSGLGHLALTEEGTLLREWQIGRSSLHWADQISGTDYLLTSDDRHVARLDVHSDEAPILGAPFAGDDVEHLQYNHTTKRAFASSFDRHIYEVDPETCEVMGRVFSAPFKTRWLATLEREPETLIVQCRNGSLHKVNVDTGETLASVRTTPTAIWTAAPGPDGELILAGEGHDVLRVRSDGIDAVSRIPYFSSRRQRLDLDVDGHTKRLAVDEASGRIIMGRTDGNIVLADARTSVVLTNVGSAVRDLTLGPAGVAYVATEAGAVKEVDLARGTTTSIFESPKGYPIWSIAWQAETQTLAILERFGGLHLLDAMTGEVVTTDIELSRCKRAKWVDENLLMYSTSERVEEFDRRTGAKRIVGNWAGNTVEDFIWDPARRYVIAISYLCKLYLFDYVSGETIVTIRDQIDYSKGLCWLQPVIPAAGYPLDLATFGRSGTMHLYRVHDDNLVALGPALTAPTGLSLSDSTRSRRVSAGAR